MFTDFISRILGAELRFSASSRQVKATTLDVIEKSSTNTKPIPEKYKKDIEALRDKFGDNFKTGLCINLTLQEALSIIPKERRRVDSYAGLISYLKKEQGITLTIKSQKTKL